MYIMLYHSSVLESYTYKRFLIAVTYLRQIDPNVSKVNAERSHHTSHPTHHTTTAYSQRPAGPDMVSVIKYSVYTK